jgi:hypothetical protein
MQANFGVAAVRVSITPIIEREREMRTMFLRPAMPLKMMLKTRPMDAPMRMNYCMALLSDMR